MTNIGIKCAEEHTLAIFNKFLFEELPNILRRNVVLGKSRSILEFSLKDTDKKWPAKMAIFEYSSETNQYNFEVIKDDFMKYMQSICLSGLMSSQPSETGRAFITINTAKLITYLEERYPGLVRFPEIDWESDYTYNIFESFVFDEVPKIIERCKMEGNESSNILFSLEEIEEDFPAKMAMFKYQSQTNTYCARVKKDEFMSYMLQLPFNRYLKPTKENHGSSWIQFDTERLDNYYLEELQREEYQKEKFTL